MDNKIKIELKEALQKELVEVVSELGSVGRVNPANPSDWEAMPDKKDVDAADPNEVADSIESYEENTAILKQLEIRLNEVKYAIDRMEKETFGICSVCGKEIEIERLRANPAATTCLTHREK